MKGGYQDNESMSVKGKARLSSGLIPITAKILSELTSPDDAGVEYKSVNIHDVLIAGTLIGVNDSETKMNVKIWDHTGIVNITFFNRNEFESLSDLKNLAEHNMGRPVKIFGTIKYYKKNASINGAKMILIKENELIQHFMEVVHSWMYLTGKLRQNEENENQMDMSRYNNNGYNNNTNNSFNNNNFSSNSYQGSNVYQFNNHGNQYQQTGVGMRNNNLNNNLSRDENVILSVVREISNKTNNGCRKVTLVDNLRNSKALSSNFENALDNLLNNGYLIEEDDILKPTGNY